MAGTCVLPSPLAARKQSMGGDDFRANPQYSVQPSQQVAFSSLALASSGRRHFSTKHAFSSGGVSCRASFTSRNQQWNSCPSRLRAVSLCHARSALDCVYFLCGAANQQSSGCFKFYSPPASRPLFKFRQPWNEIVFASESEFRHSTRPNLLCLSSSGDRALHGQSSRVPARAVSGPGARRHDYPGIRRFRPSICFSP